MARMIMNTDNLQPMPQEPAQAVQPAMAQPAMQPAAPVEHRRSRSAQPAPMAAPQPMQQPVMQPQAAPQPVRQAPPQPVMPQQPVMQPDPEEARYAHMFASWDLLPPQVLIRRVTRK